MASRSKRPVEVDWLDTTTHGPWKAAPELVTPLKVRSVGFLVRKDSRLVIIAQSASENGGWADTTAIPRPNVKAIRFLRGGRGAR